MSDPAGGPTLWSTVRDAVRGTDQDLTAIPLGRAVILLAVPTLLEMSMESLFAIADIFYVSKLGSDPVATVGLTESFLSLIYALAMGLSAGATAMIARRVGEKAHDAAATASVQVIIAAVTLAAAFGVVGAFSGPRLLVLMGASPALVDVGWRYTSIMLGGSITVFLLFVVNAIFRGAGSAAIAMRTLWLANGLNIVVAPFLIFGIGPFPRLGVTGAAIATTASRGVGVLYQIVMLSRARGAIAIRRSLVRLDRRVMRELLRLSSSAALQTLIETASWLGLVRILSTYGGNALAGYSISMRIVIFALLPSWGLAMAASTLVGQNLGANEPDRAERSVSTIARYNVVFLGAVSVVFAVFPAPIVRLFTTDPEVAAYAADCLRIVALGFVFYAAGMVCMQAFNGAGDTRTPMIVNAVCFWCFKIPMAYVLAKGFSFGPRGVYLAIALAYTLQSCIAYVLFRRGRWKATKIA